jgi:hypothetical protein
MYGLNILHGDKFESCATFSISGKMSNNNMGTWQSILG